MNQLKDYLDQLQEMADAQGVELLHAFKQAGVPDSTFYRAKYGQGLRRETAQKVANVLSGGRQAA